MQSKNFDPTDLQILAALQVDGRLSSADLAERVSLTPSPCWRRVKRLEDEGVIRGFNAVTGQLDWAWDMGRPGETALPPDGEVYTPGTPNVWTIASGDDELGLVYMPMGNSAGATMLRLTMSAATSIAPPSMAEAGSR